MIYLDYETYQELGGALDEETFNSILPIAQSIIDIYSYNRLTRYNEIPEQYIDAVAKATYYQLEYINKAGGKEAALGTGGQDEIKTESIGNYSVTLDNSNKPKPLNALNLELSSLSANELDKVYLRSQWIR